MTTERPIAVLLAATVLFAACGEETLPIVDPFGDETWRLVDGVADDMPLRLVDTHPVTLGVDDGRVGGVAACNTYGGDLTRDGAAVTITDLVQTEMACMEDGVMELEAAFLTALLGVTSGTREASQLVLSGEGVTLRFEPVEPEARADLYGTDWVLDALVDGDAVSTPSVDARIRFEADGTVTGHNGCNGFGGRYDAEAGFSDLMQTLIGCFGPVAQQETFVMGVLGGDPTLAVDGTRLTITSADGRGLIFRVAS